MVELLQKVLCFFHWHRPPPSVNPATSIYWYCRTCGETCPGGELIRRRR